MKDLPLAARWYLSILWSLAAILVCIQLYQITALVAVLPLLLGWLPLFILADYFEVEFELGDGKPVVMTVADTPMIFLLAVGGPVGVVGIAVGTMIVDVLRRRAWYKNLFNTSVRVITYLLMALVYGLLQTPGPAAFNGLFGLVAL